MFYSKSPVDKSFSEGLINLFFLQNLRGPAQHTGDYQELPTPVGRWSLPYRLSVYFDNRMKDSHFCNIFLDIRWTEVDRTKNCEYHIIEKYKSLHTQTSRCLKEQEAGANNLSLFS